MAQDTERELEQHYRVDRDYWNEYGPVMWWYMENPEGSNMELIDFLSERKRGRDGVLLKKYEERYPHAPISDTIRNRIRGLNSIAMIINEDFSKGEITVKNLLGLIREAYEIIYEKKAWF